MHFAQLLLLVASGMSAIASASPNADPAPMQVGRRLSRKAIQRRHWRHGHHHNNSTSTSTSTPDNSTLVPTPVDNSTFTDEPAATSTDGGDCTDTPLVTVYTTVTSTPVPADVPTSTDSVPAPANTDTNGTTTSTSPAPSSSPSGGVNGPSDGTAVIQATSPQCGSPNANPAPQPTSGPNGDENWLNCGVDNAGWVPPPVTLDNLIYRNLSDVLQENGNPFSACAPYLSMFEDMEAQTGVPTIFLASISLQESGCDPTVTGGAGEIGMMQITSEKCPQNGDCYDPETNISIGSQYFKTVITDQCNGNVACAMGAYNGWVPGLTVAAANDFSTCAQHNNLDYLQFVFNWYLQGQSPPSDAGIYHNTC
jgi:hypothetical protein